MATQTNKLKLTKPSYSDTADIMPINANMDVIDSEFIKVDREINDLKNKNNNQDVEINNLKNSINGIKLEAENVSIKDVANNFVSTNVEGALSELFQDVDSGKSLIAGAITDKGVNASKDESYEVLSNKIRQISGIDIIARSSLPTTGKENQVCVITDVVPNSIKVGHFASDLDYGTNKDIYICLSDKPIPTQDILLKDTFNSIKLWLYSCKQVVNGTEQQRRVYKYVNGKWVIVLDIHKIVYLYNQGITIENQDIFGQLVQPTYNGYVSYSIQYGTLKILKSGLSTGSGSLYFNKHTNLAKYSKLFVEIDSCTVGNAREIKVGVSDMFDNYVQFIKSTNIYESYDKTIVEVDLSDVNVYGFIGFYMLGTTVKAIGDSVINIKKIWVQEV